MRILLALLLPLLLQVAAYVLVFAAARGGGSFMGLFAMPVAAVALIALLLHGALAARGSGSLLSASLVGLGIALLPPIGLLVLRAMGV